MPLFGNIATQTAQAGLKGMFEPSLKLERDNAAMAGFPVLIQIGRAKVAVKVSLGRADPGFADLRML